LTIRTPADSGLRRNDGEKKGYHSGAVHRKVGPLNFRGAAPLQLSSANHVIPIRRLAERDLLAICMTNFNFTSWRTARLPDWRQPGGSATLKHYHPF